MVSSLVARSGSAVAALRSIFNINILSLTDTVQGQVAEAISVTGRTMTQYNGVLVPLGATEPHVQRGHRVENLLSYSEDFSNAVWLLQLGANKIGVTSVVGESAMEIAFSSDPSSAIYHTIAAPNGADVIGLFWVRAKQGSTSVRIYMVGFTANIAIDDTKWWPVYRRLTATNPTIYLVNNDAGNASNVYVLKSMASDATGMPASYVPPYVPRDTAVGDELVTNGTFDTDTAGWTPTAGTIVWDASGRALVSSSSAYSSAAVQNFPILVGMRYKLAFDTANGTSAIQRLTAYDAGGTHISHIGAGSYLFTATGNTLTIWLETDGAGTGFFDNITVKEASTGIKVFDTTSGNTVSSNIVTEASGLPLHPSKLVDGDKWYESKEAWSAKVWPAGSECEHGGRWYSTVAGGTDVTFGSAVTWVDMGIYNRAYGALSECVDTNQIWPNRDFSHANWVVSGSSVSSGLGYFTVAQTATSGQHLVNYAAPIGTMPTCYIDAENDSGAYLCLRLSGAGIGAGWATFDLVNGVITSSGGTYFVSANIQHIYGSKWRCILKHSSSSTFAKLGIGVTTDGTQDLQVTDAGNVANKVRVYLAQGSSAAYPSSPIDTTNAPATRTEGLGAYKWALLNSVIITTGPFTMVLGYVPSYSGTDLVAAARALLSFDNTSSNLLHQSSAGALVIAASDGANTVSVTASSWAAHDSIVIAIIVNSTLAAINDTPLMTIQVAIRNLSKGESITVASAPYDGAFASNLYLQIAKALGGNNFATRNLRQYDTCIPHADITTNFT